MNQTRRHFFAKLCSGMVFLPLKALSETSKSTKNSGDTVPGESDSAKAVLMAVGDIMMHKGNILGGYNPETNSYDFSPYFEYVKPIFKKADWVIGNLETCLAGKDTAIYLGSGKWEKGYTAWPFFNAPEILAENLKDAGFTILSTANNHSLDRYVEGIIRTNNTLDMADLMHTGTFSSPDDRNTVRISQKKGIKMAFFAYTYDTNGIRIPEGKEYMVNLIDIQHIEQDFGRARKIGVDCITCYLHFGNEYRQTPDEYQLDTTDKVLELGADIIMGSHPHVVQPYKVVTINGKKKIIMYSLGNFLSNMRREYEDIGVIFCIDLTVKRSCIRCRISDITTILTRVYKYYERGKRTYRIVPIKNMLQNRGEYNVSDAFYNETEKLYGTMNHHIQSMLGN